MVDMDKIVSLCKRRGFIFRSRAEHDWGLSMQQFLVSLIAPPAPVRGSPSHNEPPDAPLSHEADSRALCTPELSLFPPLGEDPLQGRSGSFNLDTGNLPFSSIILGGTGKAIEGRILFVP